MAKVVIRLARTTIRSLYRQLIKAMGRKLLGLEVDSFLWIRMVVASFHAEGTSCALKQWWYSLAKMWHLGSRRLRCLYSRQSCPGAELTTPLSLKDSSSGVGGAKSESSGSTEGTWAERSSSRVLVSQVLGPKAAVK